MLHFPLFFAIAAALALALVAPKETFRRLAGGAVAWAAAVAGVTPAFSTAASPLTASAMAALATAGKLAGTIPVPVSAGGVIAAPPAAGAMAAPAAVLPQMKKGAPGTEKLGFR